LIYDESKAIKVLNFFEDELVFSAGKWAGQPFRLMDWQWEEIIAPLFGTLQYENGPRQYRTCYVEVPKKSGKTEVAAGIALYMLYEDGENSPEVYSAAADRAQATLVYKPAAYMVRHNKKLKHNLKVLDSQKRIICHHNYGFYQVLSSEVYTKHCINPSCVIIDELHGHPNDGLVRVLVSGTDYAREQQLIFIITTAGLYDIGSAWWRYRERARQIKAGVIQDESLLPVLYIADPEKDNPEDEEVWKRVNPALGQIFNLEKIRKDFNIAKQNPVDYADFLRFRLNIPVKQIAKWIPMDHWDKCKAEIDIESLRGRKCYAGLDLSDKIDLSSLVLVFPPAEIDEPYKVLSNFYLPEETILRESKKANNQYDIWSKNGWITSTDGNVIDYSYIENDACEYRDKFGFIVEQIAYDPRGATQLAVRLQDEYGFETVEVTQGFKHMSEPTKDVRAKIIDHKFAYDGNPVMRWCADNLTVKTGGFGDVYPDKSRATEKIDGMVALIMAWGRAIFAEPTEGGYGEAGHGVMII